MSGPFFELLDDLLPLLRAGDLESCTLRIAQRLSDLPESPFHIALGLNVTNDPSDVAAYFDGFFRQESARFDIAAGYTEMNGFDINPDRWYFDCFAFKGFGGREDYAWLSDWESEVYPEMTITGLESLQKVFENSYDDHRFEDASDLAGLLVVTKFQDLIRRSSSYMSELGFPLLVTAHDYDDFIYEVRKVG